MINERIPKAGICSKQFGCQRRVCHMRESIVFDHSLHDFEVGPFVVIHWILLGLGLCIRIATLIGALERGEEADETALRMIDLLIVMFSRANVERGHGKLRPHELDNLIVISESGILFEDCK